jgi:RHS repeat-associated protein
VTTSFQEHGGAVNTSTTPRVQYGYADGSENTVRPTSLTYPNGRVLTYSYSGTANDRASRVDAMQDGSATLAEYTYLGLGSVVEVDYHEPAVRYTLVGTTGGNDPDTGDIYRGLDRFGRVKDSYWRDYGSSADVDRIKYGYDRAGNRIWRENVVAASLSKPFDELYAHDGLHRLKDMQRGTLSSQHSAISSQTFGQCWTLDETGNWKGFRQDSDGNGTWDLAQQRTANAVNEITGVTETSGPSWSTPAYDAAGNMTSVPKPADPTQSFVATYDAWSRLVRLEDETPASSSSSASSSAGLQTVQENVYDGRNYRVVRKDYADGALSETRHLYYSESWQSLEERLDSETDADRQHVWGLRYIDDLVCRHRDADADGYLDERLYALQDANWNVTAVVDAAGSVQERYSYTAYGEAAVLDSGFVARSPSYDWDVLYAGYRWDPESGLYAVRRRTLHSALGRWLHRDLIGYQDSSNLFQYAHSSPLMLVDPLGLRPNQQETISLNDLVQYVQRLEREHPGETPQEILQRLRDGVKGPRRCVSAGNSSGLSGSHYASDSAADSASNTSDATAPPPKDPGLGWTYIYTEQEGWIDLGHFTEAARYGVHYTAGGVEFFGDLVEYQQGASGWYSSRHGLGSSAFSPEDYASNRQGALFGNNVAADGRKLSEQLLGWFGQLQATDPTAARDYNQLPRSEAEWEQEWQDLRELMKRIRRLKGQPSFKTDVCPLPTGTRVPNQVVVPSGGGYQGPLIGGKRALYE